MIIVQFIAYIIKNFALLLGVIESLLKLASGIVSLTPTKKDDILIQEIDKWFTIIKRTLYERSEKISNGNSD